MKPEDAEHEVLDMHKKFTITRDVELLNRWLEHFKKCDEVDIRDRLCVVSIIGKSPRGHQGCKAAGIDEAVGRNVFRGRFAEKMTFEGPLGSNIEAYYDQRNKVMFLHMLSSLDTDILVRVTKQLSRELNEKGFLQVWTDLQLDVAKTLLMLFVVSHIVITVQPSLQFDMSYLHLFRVLEMARIKAQPYMSEVLSGIYSLSGAWVESGRPCSPRMLFVFESFGSERVKADRRQYELYLEDQIYRFLRKSRIITNICANSLFAICNQMDFVYVSVKDSTIRKADTYLSDLVLNYLTNGTGVGSDERPSEENDDHAFYSFLWAHINVALSKGFDDNVGRHNVVSVFEKPTVKDFIKVLSTMSKLLFDESDGAKETRIITNHMRNCLDTDIRFSESRCSKGLPMAMGVYQESLPSHYTHDYHERKVAQALQTFTLHARGPALFDYAAQLREDCDRFWKNGRQMCEVLSLTANNCINPIHRAIPEEEEFMPDYDGTGGRSSSEVTGLGSVPHCSSYKLVSACNCGRRQLSRDDPFTVKAANHDFYVAARMKCSCSHMDGLDFPIFEPSTPDVKAGMSSSNVDTSVFFPIESVRYNVESASGTDQEFQSQPELQTSFTNFSQSSLVGDTSQTVSKKEGNVPEDTGAEAAAYQDNEDNCEESEEDDDYDDEEYDVDDDYGGGAIAPYMSIGKQSSTTEYLPGMLHTMSPAGLLPKFSSWSLLCLGPSSFYSHNLGLHDQPGFMSGTNFLLPWDVTVKLEHSGSFPPLWEGKRPPGIKNKKNLRDGTQFTVKVFLGIEYECSRGHRFISSGPNSVLKASQGVVKENGSRLATNDMPLYMPCLCSRPSKFVLAQLMRLHIVTPKAPVHVTLNPRVQPAPSPSPVFYPGNLEPIKLSQSTYWVLRLPFVYEGDHGVYTPPKDQILMDSCRLLKGVFGVTNIASKGSKS